MRLSPSSAAQIQRMKEEAERARLEAERARLEAQRIAAEEAREALRRAREEAAAQIKASTPSVPSAPAPRAPSPPPPPPKKPTYELVVDGVPSGTFDSPDALSRAASKLLSPGQEYEILKNGQSLGKRKAPLKKNGKGGGFPWGVLAIPAAAIAVYAAS